MRNYKITSVEFTPTPEKWAEYKDKQDACFHIAEAPIFLGYFTVNLEDGTKYQILAGVKSVGECGIYDTTGKHDNVYGDDVADLAENDKGLAALLEKGWAWQNNPWYEFVFMFEKNGNDLTPYYMWEGEPEFDFENATEDLQYYTDKACIDLFYDILDKIV